MWIVYAVRDVRSQCMVTILKKRIGRGMSTVSTDILRQIVLFAVSRFKDAIFRIFGVIVSVKITASMPVALAVGELFVGC